MYSFEKIVSPQKIKSRRYHCRQGIKALVPVVVLGSLIRGAKAYLELAKEVGQPVDNRVAIDLTVAEPIYKRMARRNVENWKRWQAATEKHNLAKVEDERAVPLAGDTPAAPLATLGDALENARQTRW